MVQILEGNSYGSKLGAALGGGLGQGFSSGMQFAQKTAAKNEGKLDFSKLLGQMKKTEAGGELQGQESDYPVSQMLESMDPMQKIQFADTSPQAYKEMVKASEKEQAHAGIKTSLDWLDKNIGFSGKHGISPRWGGIEALGTEGGLAMKDPVTGQQLSNLQIKKIREEIDQTGLLAADAVYTHFNKGVLNKVKWEDVKELFSPKSDLPAEVNRARIASLRRIMGLKPNISKEALNKQIDKEANVLKKIEKSGKSKKLTDDVLDKFLSEANDDPVKAAELAHEAGYSW